jgi:hypothetical protein
MFLLLVAGWAWGQTFRPEQVMVMLIGASASRPTADQQAVLERLKQLRAQPNFKALKIGLMHFDRPSEAKLARTVLGIDSSQLPCLCLVQLDQQGRKPVRNLYSIARVNRSHLNQVESMGQQWLSLAGVASGPRSILRKGETFSFKDPMRSPNGAYSLALQPDGNVVLYQGNRALWSTNTVGAGGVRFGLSHDGLLRLLANDGRTVWQNGPQGGDGNYSFSLQDDGNMVVYLNNGGSATPVWSSNTAGR